MDDEAEKRKRRDMTAKMIEKVNSKLNAVKKECAVQVNKKASKKEECSCGIFYHYGRKRKRCDDGTYNSFVDKGVQCAAAADSNEVATKKKKETPKDLASYVEAEAAATRARTLEWNKVAILRTFKLMGSF